MRVSGLAWKQAFWWVCASIFAAWLPSSAAAAVTASYSDVVSADSGQCVAIAGNSGASGAGVVQVSCAGQGNTTWSFVPVGANYHIVLQGSGLCLNVPGGSRTSGTPLIQYPCQGDSLTNDQWTITAVGASYRIVSVSSGMCVNVNGGSRASGAQLIQYPCQGASALNDQFNLYLPVAAFSNIVSAGSGRCLTVSGNSTGAGAAIVQGACSTQGNAGWSLLPAGSGYHVVSQRTGQCLNVSGGVGGSGTPVIQYPCQGDAQTNDQWTVAAASGSYYRLMSVASGMCLNVSGGALSDGAALIQYPCQGAGALNDQFTLGLPQSFPVTLPSAWSAVIPLPVNPIGIANVPNGKLVMWSADQTFSFQNDVGNKATQTQTALFDPATNRATQFLETSAGSDMFCPGTAMLSDGRLLVNGGDSSPKTTLYDWNSNTWSAAATMNIPRGYQGDTLLSNGSVLTLGGSWSGGQGGKSAEIWNGGNWTVLPGVPETSIVGPDPQGIYRGDNHLWLFAQGNGSVFHAGPSAQMNWISTTGSGAIQSAGTRGTDPY
ncbi:MAG: RICIN domain-containing protein, partial [Burkholderia sp.]|nr:RICIN domain-containing protein [Burkholderia sp.]